MHWLYAASVTIGGHQITYREIAGNLIGLASAIGGMRRRVWAWPVGIVGNVLLFTVFLGTALGQGSQAPLVGQAGRQVFFAITSVYGWYRWSNSKRAGASVPAVVPRWATARERIAYLVFAAVAVAVCDVAFHVIGEGFAVRWWYYLADSWIFVGSMVATFAMARGWVDFWLCWIAVDLVGVPELLHFQYYPSATLYAIYAGFVVWGFFVWRRAARDEPYPSPLTPVQEAVG
ncbi:MAG: nicotinamide mononucleotide transporter family protein [Acidothermaceae bacterium]